MIENISPPAVPVESLRPPAISIKADDLKAHPLSNPATHVAIAMILVVVAMTTAAFLAKFAMVPWTCLIFIAGTVGGVVNSFRRTQKLSTSRARATNPMTARLITLQIYVSPFVGGVFAIVLYGIFMSGFVQGSFFPAFAHGEEKFDTFRNFAGLDMPVTNADVAKSLVWAFIAGFSEGLVPNFITKLASETDAKNRGAA